MFRSGYTIIGTWCGVEISIMIMDPNRITFHRNLSDSQYELDTPMRLDFQSNNSCSLTYNYSALRDIALSDW